MSYQASRAYTHAIGEIAQAAACAGGHGALVWINGQQWLVDLRLPRGTRGTPGQTPLPMMSLHEWAATLAPCIGISPPTAG